MSFTEKPEWVLSSSCSSSNQSIAFKTSIGAARRILMRVSRLE